MIDTPEIFVHTIIYNYVRVEHINYKEYRVIKCIIQVKTILKPVVGRVFY